MSRTQIVRFVVAVAIAVGCAAVGDAAEPESKRLAMAKDFIYDEQWQRAIAVLRQAAADPAENRRDEALYWLAHSLNQSGDSAAAVETISRLEREFPSSIWVKPARSLRIEIAVRLNRTDVLWWTALPPPPAAPVVKPEPPKGKGRPSPPSGPKAIPVAPSDPPTYVPPPPPPRVWFDPESFRFDDDDRILALSELIKIDASKVIPLLGQIAWQTDNPGSAGRAIFMLAQSDLPEAKDVVLKIAKDGPEPVRSTAVREWSRFGGPNVSKQLLQFYPTAIRTVKVQIVKSLGERAEKVALVKIVTAEQEPELRNTAISCLALAGGAGELAVMYKTFPVEGKRQVIISLSTVRADAELVGIAESEADGKLKAIALDRLRVLGTPRAKEYLQKVSEKR